MYKYIVYKTTNIINNKIYIGVHRTNMDVKDPYIGCGISCPSDAIETYWFHQAVRKYGFDNFQRETLFEYPDTEAGMKMAYDKEGEIVNEKFLKRKDVYNMTLGGRSSMQAVNANKKVVYQFDLQGNYINYYKSLHEATEKTGVDYRSISQVCLGKSGQAGGFYWNYKKRFDFDPKKIKKTSVACYTDNGDFIESFTSLTEAAKCYKVSPGGIHNCISGKQKHTGKVRWRYFYGDVSKIDPL